MGKYVNWIHGSDVNVEWTNKIHDGGSNSARGHPRPTGRGTIVRQENGVNWFHFAIPTPTVVNGDITDTTPVVIEDVFLHATVNESARVDRVHVWDGDTRIWARNDIEGLENEEIVEKWNITDDPVSRGVVISVRVDFDAGDEIGTATFHSAGAQFDDEMLAEVVLDTLIPG